MVSYGEGKERFAVLILKCVKKMYYVKRKHYI